MQDRLWQAAGASEPHSHSSGPLMEFQPSCWLYTFISEYLWVTYGTRTMGWCGDNLTFFSMQQLMQQAQWNLCPFEAPFTSACYYSADITLDQLSGSSSNVRISYAFKVRGTCLNYQDSSSVSFMFLLSLKPRPLILLPSLNTSP